MVEFSSIIRKLCHFDVVIRYTRISFSGVISDLYILFLYALELAGETFSKFKYGDEVEQIVHGNRVFVRQTTNDKHVVYDGISEIVILSDHDLQVKWWTIIRISLEKNIKHFCD